MVQGVALTITEYTPDSTGEKNNVLRFRFYEPYDIRDSSFLNYKIFDLNYTLIQIVPSKSVIYHDNHIEIDFDQLGLNYGLYIIEVTNSKKEKWFLKFLYDEE